MSLELHEVRHRYPSSRRVILDGVDLQVPNGTAVSVSAPSGAGKTTLLAIAGLLLRPTSGTVTHDGRPPGTPGESTVWVLQTINLLPRHTAAHNVALPLLAKGWSRWDAELRAHEALDQLGLIALAERRAGTLSGGEAQRVGVARALVSQPSLILADEPTANLDPTTALEVAQTLMVARESTALLVATHDPQVAALADRHMVLLDGRLQEAERVALA